MKIYLVGIGILLILSFSFLFTVDSNQYIEQDSLLDNTVKDCANAAALYLDLEEYSEGFLVFNDSEGLAVIEDILSEKYGLDNDLVSENNFLPNTFSYEVHYFDDSLYHRTYIDGSLSAENSFSYGTLFTDCRGVERLIVYPTVIVQVNAGNADFQLNALSGLDEMKSVSAYAYMDD